ncbi:MULTISPECIES: phosphoribosylamine--glycine ligase [unclassified Actinomyces]|uniref:phosphoribosylamine--glycine ligase n=2 Tax=Actinomyces TaxID=1654 RepID=UPI002017AA9A|nr:MULTISPECIES: phosphoribosylamine--glycine ligase [unclassified Actinomyces]MCL3777766.1 phosphoribosylamine--glycine ligase [Actinomyces sp. AC-20-1]MCL3789472.1 phosphoribosylamine--glycine ligase [Actinomyces sp. 187325]MCL3791775.1 phosphoribosylamine--glycine ligase [Actinomyces sp. 186855]MCL3794865.1 phosphoribosylamine--glycine ligase [Actinomyces sp. 217892]
MKILLLGSGAREHALARALAPAASELVAVPGNPGIATVALPTGTATTIKADPASAEDVVPLAREMQADLVVIGPEAPLVAGVADALREAGVPVFGPGAEAARLEGSKAFAKEVMEAAGVPTAEAAVCATREELEAALDRFGAPHVVKDDGLAAGKGVVVTSDREAALAHGLACLGKEGGRVVVEDFLDGPEVSLFCVCDGATVRPLAPAQDFKRLADGDAGPNTGGMGAYTPLTWAPEDLGEQVVREVAQPVVDEMARRGTPFTGLLYCGLALTAQGLRVVEFNVRFGDPETQAVLARLTSSLPELLLACATGRLHEVEPPTWSEQAAVDIVLAAPGYPGTVTTGGVITGIEAAEAVAGVHVLHAGTGLSDDGELVATGGRVLSVVALGDDVEQARARAYEAVSRIHLEGAQYRTDIAAGR